MTCSCSRREFLARGLYGISLGAGLPIVLDRTTAALTAQALQGTSMERHPERILVVLELSSYMLEHLRAIRWSPHVALHAGGASQIVSGTPPAIDTFFNAPSA